MSDFVFHRAALASSMIDAVTGNGILDASSGLFLAAPRRTGKSTFLTEDLIPALKSREVLPIYVDLWEDRRVDPSIMIASAIKKAIAGEVGVLSKAARQIGITKVSTPIFSFDLDKIGREDGATLKEALESLIQKRKRPVALIVDEAQHATLSNDGMNAMFALKSARDTINSGGNHNLLLVFTGSHRDRLARLVTHKDQPFFGARVTDFKLLGRDYCEAYTQWFNRSIQPESRLEVDDVYAAFDTVGHRPELLKNVVADAFLNYDGPLPKTKALRELALLVNESLSEELSESFFSLTPVQRAVLLRISNSKGDDGLFSSSAMTEYADLVGSLVTASSAQSALRGLRDLNIVWKSANGTYETEDPLLERWLKNHPKGFTETSEEAVCNKCHAVPCVCGNSRPRG
ncbi:hypothetical protein [Ferrovum myxofaciens]|jgi:hypothetical protein|uniref:ATPase n=2 Tax=root TaxID=1 RepID=A0A8F3DT88_9PROT|nr:hypothetical protein [Ferrovum myxofaciens]KXW57109.1 hypothetical protein FEMY_23720 [Ferrovum myxofaciens]QKE39131.1 MAG: hypothetical protein HO273_10720 [Ferrovum myxofaciens]QWY74372.1 MAG: hypothetical protein JVY19_11265 [Ferrovum myxofaciens]QWY77123.1 MAG: hypothetical protein JZL65_11710 [Ferrovum myxofaciens]